MKHQIYQWQGEPVKVEFGYSTVKTVQEKPLWWYNYETSLTHEDIAVIPAVRVTAYGEPFILSNHNGIAVNKLSKGGWPNMPHFSLPSDSFKECSDEWCNLNEFDELEYSQHESERNKWQKKNFPEEYEKLQSLRRSFPHPFKM